MRLRLALALVGSLLLHAVLLGLLPLMGEGDKAKLPPPPSRLQVRMLPPAVSDLAAPAPLIPEIKTQPSAEADQNLPRQQQAAARKQLALGVTSILPQTEPEGTQGNTSTAPQLTTPFNPDRGTEQRLATPPAPLNLSIPTTPMQPRTALQTTIEQQAIRPDTVVARSFERALAQTAPVATEISQTVDASGNATVKVRTAGGTYCLKNSTPPGATLYELKTLAGNCPN